MAGGPLRTDSSIDDDTAGGRSRPGDDAREDRLVDLSTDRWRLRTWPGSVSGASPRTAWEAFTAGLGNAAQ
jgi:hypothetical protein